MMDDFNPLEISEKLKGLYQNFIFSSFPIKNSSIKSQLKNMIHMEKLLWNGPYISLASKYKKGNNAKSFLQKYNFHRDLIQSLRLDRFYMHQEIAIKSIKEGKHTIISTGTGSGKTEAFLLPIIDYCLQNPKPGLKAIIVYPMNALANDQMLRLRTFLYKINSKLPKNARPITFCKYTGQTPEDEREDELKKIPPQRCKVEKTILETIADPNCPEGCDHLKLSPELRNNVVRLVCKYNPNYENNFEIITRKEIRQAPPDILITNYVQLEYMLLRREDAEIFKSPCMKFLVFDEIHWYSGATGAEVALLIRRLKARIRKYSHENIVCIGTSATISSREQARNDIANFASQLFGERILFNNVIVGEKEELLFNGDLLPPTLEVPKLYTPTEICNMNESDYMKFCEYFSSEIPPSIPSKGEERLVFLGNLLSRNKIFKNIVDIIYENPRCVEDICEDIKLKMPELSNSSKEKIKDIVWNYLYVGSIAETHQYEPLIRPQVHLFFKTLGEEWPFGEIFVCIKCWKIYAKPHERCPTCDGAVEELGVCRFCGAEFYRSVFDQDPTDQSLGARKTIGKEATIDCQRKNYNEDGYRVWQTFENPADENFVHQKKCVECGSLNSNKNTSCSFCHSTQLVDVFLKARISECPFCGRSYGGRSEAVSSVYISPNTTSRLVFDLNYILLPEEKRKILVFSDSRQDASYMAGTIGEEHLTHMLRQIITQVVWNSNGDLAYSELEESVLKKIQDIDPSLSENEIKQKLLIEITSVAARQRSAENLGLISVEYTNIATIDVSGISAMFGISEDVCRHYLITLLNEIRQDGALEGLHNIKIGRRYPPKGVVCELSRRKGNFTKNLLADRGGYIKYTKKVFPGKDSKKIIESAFELLKKYGYLKEVKVGIYYKKLENGFVITKDKIKVKKPTELYVCNTCGRVYTNTANGICPAPSCNGRTTKMRPEKYYSMVEKFHIRFYKDLLPVKLEVKEDTGYVPTDKRQKLELDFRSGKVDMLVATPTLELGIDIGDLVCVGLMKSPPSPGNYAQRVGRAGRETKVAMSTAFMFQNPIDQYYFDSPLELISGEILAPALNLNNPYIVKRHIHSLILEELLVTPPSQPAYYVRLMKEFIDGKCKDALSSDLKKSSNSMVDLIKSTFGDINLQGDLDPSKIIKEFPNNFENAVNSYQQELAVLKDILNKIREQQDDAIRKARTTNAKQELRRLRRMQGNIEERYSDLNQCELFSHLSAAGMIPRYAFPGKAVRVISLDGKEYPERQMPIALYELAPGMPVYLGGMKNRVIGLAFGQDPEMMKTTKFYVCENCKIYAQESMFEECPECGARNSAKPIQECYEPTAVVVKEEGKPSEEGRESAYPVSEVYLLQPLGKDALSGSDTKVTQTPLGEAKLKLLGRRTILTIVSGIMEYDSTAPQTFTLCEICGFYLGGDFSTVQEAQQKKHLDILGRGLHQSSNPLKDIKLYHKFNTSALLLTLPNNDPTFLTTFKNAIINAAQRIVGADDGEIEGIIKDNNLILYDNVEGGAGYVNTIFEKFEEILDEAKNIVLNCPCERGCLKCLYSYRRRRDIPEIDKKVLLDLFKTLYRISVDDKLKKKAETISDEKDFRARILAAGLESQKDSVLPTRFRLSGTKCILSGMGRLDGAIEVRDCLLSAKKSIYIVSLYISDRPIVWGDEKSFSWCDILINSKMNGVEDIKIIVRPPQNTSERYTLQRLSERGIDIYMLEDEGIAHHKIVIVDEDMPESIAVLQSANFSPEVVKNADFYIFLTKKENPAAHDILKKWFKDLIKRCKKWSGVNSLS